MIKIADCVAEIAQSNGHRNLQFDRTGYHADDQDGANKSDFGRHDNTVFVVPESLHVSRLLLKYVKWQRLLSALVGKPGTVRTETQSIQRIAE